SSYKGQSQQVEGRENVNHPFPVLGINAGHHRIAGYALHNDDLHSHLAGRSKEVPGAAGNLQLFSFLFPCKHPHLDPLLAYPGPILLQIILYDFNYFRFFKSLPAPDYQLRLFHIIDFYDEKSKQADQYEYNEIPDRRPFGRKPGFYEFLHLLLSIPLIPQRPLFPPQELLSLLPQSQSPPLELLSLLPQSRSPPLELRLLLLLFPLTRRLRQFSQW